MQAETSVRLGRLGLGAAILAAGLVHVLASEEAPALWPRYVETPQGRCTVFEPQPVVLRGEHLEARAALAVAPPDTTNVVFGIADLTAKVSQDAARRDVTLANLAVTKTTFVPAESAAMSGLAEALKPGLAGLTWNMSSDALDAKLDRVTREREAARELKSTPPKILYSPVPAALIVLDGPPQLRQLTNSPLMRAVNTPYALLFDPGTKTYWLQGADTWFSASDWHGEWSVVANPPAEVAAAVPKGSAAERVVPMAAGTLPPRIVVTGEPAELIATRGEPTYTPVDGSELLYVSNSEQLIFLEIASKQYYVVFSGRWFRSAALTGPWEAVASDQLPGAFARIPPGSPKSEALTYVAGTTEARDAVARAAIPQITAVERGPANLEVKYDGAPQFQPVPGTTMQSARNTPDAVFLVGGAYFLCRDAVWYTGPGPEGPWTVATTVPVEIQSLPPSDPHYNVKYVSVYGETPDVVYVGYVPAYGGCYVAGPTIVYGTGWWYPGWYGPACYWAYPATFGFGFGYCSWAGWSVGVGFGYGWLGCGYGWGWAGCYPLGWWGPCGAYWACAPAYPCYAGYPHHGGGHPPGPGHPGEPGHPPPHNPGGGGPPSGPPGGPPPSTAGMRAGPRKDAPSPYDRPANPQRRALPEYARTAKAPQQAPTNLNSPRRADAGSAGNPASGMALSPARASAPQRGAAGAPGPVARSGGSTLTPSRGSAGAPAGNGSVPARGVASSQTALPGRATPGYGAASPMRSGPPGMSSGQPRQGAPMRSPASSMAPSFAAPSRQTGAYSSGFSPGRSYYGGFSGGPPARSFGPTYSAPSRGGGFGSGLSAPGRGGGFSGGFSAPTRSAPMSPPSGGFGGGGMGHGGVSRGR